MAEPYFSGVDPCFRGMINVFMEVFRGKCNFIESSGVSGVRRKGTSSQPGGGDTDIIGNSPVYPEAF